MGNNKTFRNVLRLAIAAIAAPMMVAFAAQPDMPSFGMVGMAPTQQFLRLNVTNLRTPGFSFVGPPGQTLTGPCTVDLSFSDGQGTTYKRQSTHLMMDQSAHLDLMASDLPAGAATGRVEVLPEVARDKDCMLVASVEAVHTSNGQTDGYVIRKDNSSNGLMPVYGMVGMAPATQFLRFNVSNQAIPGIGFLGSCYVELSFTDGATNTLKKLDVSLAQGTSSHLDLMAADLSTDLARVQRIEALPIFVFRGRCALNSSVEVITIATEQTVGYAAEAVVAFQ